MTDFTEKVRQNALVTIIIIVVAALIITLAILLYTGVLSSQNLSFLPFVDEEVADNSLADLSSNDIDLINNIGNQGGNSEMIASGQSASMFDENGYRLFNVVSIPMLIGPEYDMEFDAPKRGCDYVWMIDRYVAPTPAPLNAAYRELFAFSGDLDFYQGNYIVRNHPNLKFDKALIENRVAKVYLTGSLSEIETDCDQDRMRVQVEETALQYPTVDAVLIYLNGVLY